MVAITKLQKKVEKETILNEMVYNWDRQPGETEKEFRLFTRYLSLGRTRNFAKVSQSCEMSYAYICDLGNRQSWKLRSDESDLNQDEEFKTRLDEEILQSRIRQQRIGSQMQKLAEKGIEMLTENVEDLSAQDISKLIDVGVKIERLALGSSTEIKESKVEAKVEVQVEEIPPEIAAKLGKELAIAASSEMEISV